LVLEKCSHVSANEDRTDDRLNPEDDRQLFVGDGEDNLLDLTDEPEAAPRLKDIMVVVPRS